MTHFWWVSSGHWFISEFTSHNHVGYSTYTVYIKYVFLLHCLQSTLHKPCVLTYLFPRLHVLVCARWCEDLPFKSGCEGNLVHPGETSHRQAPQQGPSPNPIHLLYYTNAMAGTQDTPVTVGWFIPSLLSGVRPVPLLLLLQGSSLWFLCNSWSSRKCGLWWIPGWL